MSNAQNYDFDTVYRGESPVFGGARPAWSIGRPQPELAALIDAGQVRGPVLDAGCGEAALSLELAARGYQTVGIDLSAKAIALAEAEARRRGLSTAEFRVADITDLHGYDDHFATIVDSALLHSMPVALRPGYLASTARAAAPGARFFILVFDRSATPTGPDDPVAPVTAEELIDAVSPYWTIDDVRPARHFCRMPDPVPDSFAGIEFRDEYDGLSSVGAWLLSAHHD
ncbi:thiopurine S-methyltransferase [Mycolicibacterium canariasense]|uniref:Thiopurine S-methyltransferase n=1 Tax=Mycolicibacterium canariasense TaxID=228230 RepID=A0A117ICN4_MYCCR|nr:class I SAM-dependent methyltransferase [Mycolicibacterium canariasense]MCV7207670.1 class I SAM-dependent methyltransferase [Mycolicibacterium canariasense]ORV08883.1 SAM-dependent methyltransferase [Mycolicibacterium canariasense]GAS99783.1 thiopurine S-methyltransferase [Mycolicibacterium canariasense]